MIKTDIFVVGAGMAGLTLANELTVSGMAVTCAEKARGSGGRLSSKRIEHPKGSISFDLGASGFTAKTNVFKAKLDEWQKRGVVDFWLESDGEPVYVGVPRSSSVTRYMAENTNVHFATRITKIEKQDEGWYLYHQSTEGEEVFALTQQVVLASPAPQTFDLLPNNHPLKASLEKVEIFSQWVMMVALDRPLDIPELTHKMCKSIESVSLENNKPKRVTEAGLYVYAVQASTQWSDQFINETPEVVEKLLIKELKKELGIDLDVQASYVHRWLYSQGSVNGHYDAGFLAGEDGLYVCGDYLLSELKLGGVESAFLSGKALSQYIIQQTNELARVG